jgi:hypothetical protein
MTITYSERLIKKIKDTLCISLIMRILTVYSIKITDHQIGVQD